jgi:hypothetical protein
MPGHPSEREYIQPVDITKPIPSQVAFGRGIEDRSLSQVTMKQVARTACVCFSRFWSLESPCPRCRSCKCWWGPAPSFMAAFLLTRHMTFSWRVSMEVRLSVSSFHENTNPISRDLLCRPNLLITPQRKGLLQLDMVALICASSSEEAEAGGLL